MDELSFVDHYLQHTRTYESPEAFWRWSAYAAIAGVARDNCFRKFGDTNIYPNIYVLLMADSAVQRKGAPIKLAETLVKICNNTKVISGRSSIQAILDELSRSETDKKTGKLMSGGSALLSLAELSAGIVNDPDAVKILTDIYDFKEEFTSRLRGQGIFRIKNVCFSMLAASNEDLMRDVYDNKAVYGGLLGRTFLVQPNEFRDANSLFDTSNQPDSFSEMSHKLKSIASVRGEFEFSKIAQLAYDNWYKPFRKSYEKKADKSGISGRIHTGVIKLAMILCLNQTRGLIISESHINEAIAHCTALLGNYGSFIMSGGKATTAECSAILIEDIWVNSKRRMTRTEFLQRHFYQFDVELVEKTVATLSAAGLVEEHLVERELFLEITDKAVELFKLIREEK